MEPVYSTDILNQLSESFVLKDRKGKGGETWKFVPIDDIIKRLNSVFGLRWSFEILSQELEFDILVENTRTTTDIEKGTTTVNKTLPNKPISVTTKCRITITDLDGTQFHKDGIGTKEVFYKKDGGILELGNDKKSSAAQALKKCAELLGVNLDETEETVVEVDAKINEKQKIEIFDLLKKMGQPINDEVTTMIDNMTSTEADALINNLRKN